MDAFAPTCLLIMQPFCFIAAIQSTFSALSYTSSAERRLPQEDSVRVTAPKTGGCFHSPAPKPLSTVCVCMCEIEQGILEADTLRLSCPSIFLLQYAGRDSWKGSEPSNIT